MNTSVAHNREQSLYIGIVTETYPPEINGVAMTLGRLSQGLAKRGHRVEIYTPAIAREPHAENNGIERFHMPGMAIPMYRELRFGFPAGRFFRKQWKTSVPDVLYVATEGPLGLSTVNTAHKLGIPVISGFHTNFHKYSAHYRLGWLSPMIFAYLRKLHNRTHATLVPTKQMASELQALGFNNVEVMQRGVDTDLFTQSRRSSELRDSWNVAPDEIVFLYVGRIAAEKNIEQAIETVLKASSSYRLRFVLVGDGPLREKLEKQYPDFIFCGTRQGESLARHYASADVLLFPSRTETFGNVVTEGMASGLAVVAYNEAAAHEHISNWHNGVLASDEPQQDFTAVTLELCRQRESISSMGINASRYCSALGWPHIVQQFESILCGVSQPVTEIAERASSQEASL